MGGGHLQEVVAPGGSTVYKYPSKGRWPFGQLGTNPLVTGINK